MDKRLFKLYSMVQATDNNPCFVEPEPEVRTESDLNRVLESIFTVDEKTGLPRTDIQYYLSSNANPTVKQWLIDNLMKPRADKLRSSVEGVTDDMLIEFTRQADEDVDSYRKRIYQIGVEAKAFCDAHREEVKTD